MFASSFLYILRVVLVLGLEDEVRESANKDEDAVEGEGDEEEVEVAVVPLPCEKVKVIKCSASQKLLKIPGRK